MGDLTKNFSADEFRCPCCGEVSMNDGFMQRLQLLRDAYGKAFSPVKGGGFRCVKYDGKKGTHTEGRACDPGIPREDLHEFIGLAFNCGFTGIGVKQKDGRWQVHIDDAEQKEGRPRPWLWTY